MYRQSRSFRMMRVVLLVALLAVAFTTQAQSSPRVSEARFAKLAKGVNLNGWFWYPSQHPFTWNYITDGELAMLRAAGLTHVRLPFDPDRLMRDPANPTDFDAVFLNGMHAAVSRILAADLAVIIDPHPLSAAESTFRQQIALDDAYLTNVALPFYSTLAAHFATYSPDWLFFETMNEPVMHEFFPGTFEQQVQQGIARWNVVQPQIIAALRAGAPDHTLIVKGDTWDNIDSLLALDMTVHTDPNLIFNIHYYDPFVFTHQGATWTWDAVQPLRDVPYPSSPAAVRPLLSRYTGETREALRWYGQERWDRAKVTAAIGVAAAWAAEHNVRLTVNEFGVYMPNTPAKDRLALLKDMRLAFEQYGLGWAMWNFEGGFNLVEGEFGARYIPPQMAEALGLMVEDALRQDTPAQNAVMTSRREVFRWSHLPGALRYRINIRALPWKRPYTFRQVFSDPALICSAGLCASRMRWAGQPPYARAVLEWRVTAFMAGGRKVMSAWQYFRTG